MHDPYTLAAMLGYCIFGTLWALLLIVMELQLIVHFHLYFG